MSEPSDDTLESLNEAIERVSFFTNQHWMQMSETIRLQRAEIEQMRELMREAIDTIKAFHGPDAWDIYYENAPEMKRFRAAAGEAVPTKGASLIDEYLERRALKVARARGFVDDRPIETEQDND